MHTSNLDVIDCWELGHRARNKSGNFRSDGTSLWSCGKYEIGKRINDNAFAVRTTSNCPAHVSSHITSVVRRLELSCPDVHFASGGKLCRGKDKLFEPDFSWVAWNNYYMRSDKCISVVIRSDFNASGYPVVSALRNAGIECRLVGLYVSSPGFCMITVRPEEKNTTIVLPGDHRVVYNRTRSPDAVSFDVPVDALIAVNRPVSNRVIEGNSDKSKLTWVDRVFPGVPDPTPSLVKELGYDHVKKLFA